MRNQSTYVVEGTDLVERRPSAPTIELDTETCVTLSAAKLTTLSLLLPAYGLFAPVVPFVIAPGMLGESIDGEREETNFV